MNRRTFLRHAAAAGLGLLASGCRRGARLEGLREPTVDLHVHVAALAGQVEGAYVHPRFRRSRTFRIYMWAAGVRAAELERDAAAVYLRNLLAQLRGAPSVARAVVLAMDQVYTRRGKPDPGRTEFHIPNHYVMRLAAEHEELLPGISLHPDRPDAVDELERLAEQGAVLVKWLPNTQDIDVAAARHVPFYRALARRRIPLLVHMGHEAAVGVIDQSLADPLRLRRPLDEGVTVICAHCASSGKSEGQSNFARWLSLLPRHPNLFGGLSALTQANRKAALEALLDRGDLWNRVVHGSDYPLPFFPLSSPWYFAGRLPRGQLELLQAIPNRLEREVRLKLALGVPSRVFGQWRRLLPG